MVCLQPLNPALHLHLQVQVQANSATGREKSSLESRAAKARQKAEAAKTKADAVEKAPMPKIEVRRKYGVELGGGGGEHIAEGRSANLHARRVSSNKVMRR